jgi:nitrite reductase/ring-hydroxylating ferredoxin subunit
MTPADRSCTTCPSRREFIDRVAKSVLAGAVAPVLADAIAGLPVFEAEALAQGGPEHAYPVPAGDSVTIDKKAQIIVVRFQQKAYAFNLACPHENTALKWRVGDHRFQCPKHDSKYTPDGIFKEGRATRNMDRFAIRRDAGRLVVDVDHLYRSDSQPREWAAATVAL